MTTIDDTWTDLNQQALVAAVAAVREALERHAERGAAGRQRGSAAELPPPVPALDTLVATFRLSPFERAILLLCAGIELDAGMAAVCAAAQGDSTRSYPTFGLALAALPEPHWSALSPEAPLRR